MPQSRRRRAEVPRSPCPISGSLDLIGDRWTLLVVRDLFWGKRRFGEFLESPEYIPTNILADRLGRLEQAGLLGRKPYQENPPRYDYALTRKGRDLGPVLAALVTWGKCHIPGSRTLGESKGPSAKARSRPGRKRA